jgi:hypothetical protein
MRNNRKHTHYLLPLLALLFFAQACYEPQSGCLDVNAVNYDFSADENDAAECIYPELRLRFDHVYSYADTTVSLRPRDTFYLDEAGNPFRLNRFEFLLSDVRLELADGSTVEVEDEITIFLEMDDGRVVETSVTDNFAFGTINSSSSLTIGTARESATVAGLQFFVGVAGQANQAVPDSFPITHPLGLSDSLIYFNRDSGYVFQLIELFRDTAATDTIPELLRIGTNDNITFIDLPVGAEKSPGFHFQLTLQIDYRKWLEGINVATDSEAVLAQKIVSNTAEAFSLTAVTLQGD